MSRGEAINNPSYMGKHVLCDIKLNSNPTDDDLITYIEESIKASNMNVVAKHIEPFKPQGMTGFWILSESHFSVHTYPESNYLTLCCYTCGTEGDPSAAMEHLLSKLDVKNYEIKLIERGNV
jgi:S-adenosylmethionine decarboxylase